MAHIGTASHSPHCRFFTAPLNTQESNRAWIVGIPGRGGDLRGVHEIMDAEADRVRLAGGQRADEFATGFPGHEQPCDVREQPRDEPGFWNRMPSSRQGVVRASSETKDTPPTLARSSS